MSKYQWSWKLKFISVQSCAWLSIGSVYFICLLSIIEWGFKVPVLNAIHPEWIPMKMITALCLILSATALSIIINYPDNRPKLLVARGLGIVVSLIGLSTIILYAVVLKTGNEPIVSNLPGLHLFLSSETRMALLTAILFLNIGSVIFMLAIDKQAFTDIAHSITIFVALVCYMIPISYLFEVQSMHLFLGMPVALSTGIAFCFLCFAIFMVRSGSWLMKLFTSDRVGSVMARRLLPGLLILPVIIAWLRIQGERHELFVSEVGVVFVAMTYVFCLFSLTWLTASSVNKADEKRKALEEALRISEEKYAVIYDQAPFAITLSKMPENVIVNSNNAFSELFGFARAEVIGKTSVDLGIIDADSRSRVAEELQKYGVVRDFECTRRTKDGTLLHITISLSWVTINEKKFILTTIQNITARKQAQAIMERYQLITEYARDPLLLMKLDGTIIEANYAAEELYGYTHAELLRLKIHHLRVEEKTLVNDQMILAKQKGILFETMHVCKDGTKMHVEVSSRGVTIAGEEMLLSVIRDITERKKSEEDLFKLNRTLKALSNSSQAMLHATDEMSYMNKVCRIIVEDCGHAMVWIGFAEDDEMKTVRPVASAGFEQGYLESLHITWADTERGQGPTGTAIRTGKIRVCANMHTDPSFMPWRDEALKRGYASSLVVPLIENSKAFGTINIYSKDPNPFTETEINLFSELADDLSYGIMMIRLHAANKKAEEALRLNEEKLRLKLDSILSPEVDISEQELANVIDVTAIQSLMDHLYLVTRMATAIIDLKGNVLVGTGWQDICTQFHRVNELTCKNCIESDTILSRDIKKGEFKAYKCKNNLWDVASPIYIGDKHVGNIFTGQFFYEDEVPDNNFFVNQAEVYNFKKEEYLSALGRVPKLNKDKVNDFMFFYSKLADAISKLSYSNIKLAKAMVDQKKIEVTLQESKEKLDFAMTSGNIGVWEWNQKTDEMIWDERMEQIFGSIPGSAPKTYKAFENYIYEEDITHVRNAIRNAVKEESPFDTIYRIKLENGNTKYLNAKALVNKNSDGFPIGMTGVCIDITEMKKGAEQVLFELNEELLRSNKELEQFAYVASHDLQEPLRMVSSFTQLLAQRYQDKLDQDAQEFIQFAVDGATRMQTLINDLLSYSRIHTRGKEFSKVDMNTVLGKARYNLSLKIQEKNALITNDELPVVHADEGQMTQLLQNLIGNAIKFCKANPMIYISSKEENDHYIFSVKDNGIGIEPQYFDRIFQIFQRLLPKGEYDGTGIGLAICKRVVERHGGKIWLESEINNGTTFYFKLLKNKKN